MGIINETFPDRTPPVMKNPQKRKLQKLTVSGPVVTLVEDSLTKIIFSCSEREDYYKWFSEENIRVSARGEDSLLFLFYSTDIQLTRIKDNITKFYDPTVE